MHKINELRKTNSQSTASLKESHRKVSTLKNVISGETGLIKLTVKKRGKATGRRAVQSRLRRPRTASGQAAAF